jgi:flagellar motor switch protein FliM
LQIGDVITLDSYLNADFQVMVGDLLKFYGKPGTSRGKNAIQITSVINKEKSKKQEEGKEE